MFEISLRITPAQHIAVEAILEERGAISISLQDAEDNPIFVHHVNETPLWKQITLTALFDNKIELQSLQNTLENILTCPIEISKQVVNEQDWLTTWKQGFEPLQFGDRLWVCPSWRTTPDPFAINIQLDPGIAFGTGAHPTTALCLEWLASHPPTNQNVIDFGCGSGILAIAAFYLGANSIMAIDHDPQATQSTCNNIKRNFIARHAINVVNASEVSEMRYDLIMANVLLQPLIQLEPHFATSIVTEGKIILSGILQQQYPEIERCYSIHFCINKIYSKKEWLLVEATRL